jgi:hypothetical protein
MTPGPRQLFVYWRAAAADAPAALQAVRALQDAMARRHPGLRCALYLRQDPSAAGATLMETYALDIAVAAEGLGPALQEEIEAAAGNALATWLRGARHVEVFALVDD